MTAEIVICGAGIAGISAAYHLAVRRGYLYVTGDPEHVPKLERAARTAARFGAGPVRIRAGRGGGPPYVAAPPEGYRGQPTGADLILDRPLIQEHFPFLTERAVAVLHARRSGWLSAQQLGMVLLERAKARGVKLLNARVDGVTVAGGRVRPRCRRTDRPPVTVISTRFVNAAGPLLKEVGALIGVDLPVFCECHLKVSFADRLGVIPREAPLLIGRVSRCSPGPAGPRSTARRLLG